MQHLLHITSVTPCGCDAEGKVDATLENGDAICFYYQGPDDEAILHFPVGESVMVDLVGRLCRIHALAQAAQAQFAVGPGYHFHATAPIERIDQIEGEVLYLLGGKLALHVEDEDGDINPAPGMWVRLEGEIWANDWWDA